MRVAARFALLVTGLLLVAAFFLLPRSDERIAMLADEGRHREAIALLERQLGRSPRAPRLLAALARSYAALGEYHRAIDMLDAYLALRPDDLAARERQAALLSHNGPTDRYLDALERLVAAQPSPALVTRLVELYRLHGRVEDEVTSLRAYGDMMNPTQLERLGAILAERAEWREALYWLDQADQKAPGEASAGRLLLFDVMLHGNEIDRAVQRARDWMAAWQSSFLSGKLILRMARSGHSVAASELALQWVDLMPDDLFDMAGFLAREGRPELAQLMLDRWAGGAANPTAQQLRAFVHASISAGDVQGPFAKLAQLMSTGADPELQAQLAEELANAFGKLALVSIRPLLSNDILLARPLFAADLSLFEGNREMARWFLSRIQPDHLPPEKIATWLALLRRVESQADVFDRLASLWHDRRLPEELMLTLADEAMRSGHVQMHDMIWSSMRRR